MEQKVMGLATAIIVAITIGLCFLLMYYPELHTASLNMQEQSFKRFGSGRSVLELLESEEIQVADMTVSVESPQEEIDFLKGHQIRLTLPKNVTGNAVSVESDYVNKIARITIKGISKSYFNDYPMTGSSDNIVDITYSNEKMVGYIDIAMDRVKEIELSTEDEYLYLDFLNPYDIYEHIVVIDAGHGGGVPGATKQGIEEKDIDLDIALALKEIFDTNRRNGLKVYYTRTEDVNPDFANRVGLANDTKADVFVSIHNNSTKTGRMSSTQGTRVLYKSADEFGQSESFSQLLLDKVTESLGSKDKGIVEGDDIFIVRESEVPVALVEVGFMTNRQELENLCDKEYQEQCAKAIYDGIMEQIYGPRNEADKGEDK
ncbi:MAG: N-acetylmuramoyl-L-alanine amidase [Bacteroidaceae bacterium]|nr:N-acetylmuramoyl-L-alanine amidase [Bacteroidaceae bacterium]